jgi:hypothetical protein
MAGEDKAYAMSDHGAALCAAKVPPLVAKNNSTQTGKRRKSALDGCTTRQAGYGMAQTRRAMIACIFGWGKQHGTVPKTKPRGFARVAAGFLRILIRIPKLIAASRAACPKTTRSPQKPEQSPQAPTPNTKLAEQKTQRTCKLPSFSANC